MNTSRGPLRLPPRCSGGRGIIAILLTGLLLPLTANAQQRYFNLDFETATRGRLHSWYTGSTGYEYSPDTTVRMSGDQSFRISWAGGNAYNIGVASQQFPIELVRGKHVRVSGWIRTQGVTNGYAAIWWRVDGQSGYITLDNMSSTGPRGTTGWARYAFERDISPNGVDIWFGVFLSGYGTAWFDGLEIDIDGVPFQDGPAPYIGEPTQEQLDWVRNTAIPISSADPGESYDDLMPLKDLIGDAHIVGLGEATHGTSEFFRMKHRIIDFLASEMGFTIFAIEANMPEAYRVNDYVLNGRGDPKELLKGMYFWTWNTEEVLDMILWMREFNLSGKGRMQFTGFDMQYMLVAAGIVRDFVKEADPDYLPTVDAAHALAIEVYNLKRSGSPDFAAKYDAAAEAVTAVREHLESLRSFDSGLRKDPVQRRPSQHITLDWAIQNSRIVEQATLLLADKTGLYRDEQMAANIDWILGQAPPGAKIVLWAHDYHVSRTEGAMGSHLAERHGRDYVVLGFGFHEGSYNAVGPQGLTAYNASPSFPGSVEYLCHKTGMPQFILDLRKALPDNPGAWLLGPVQFRIIGAVPADGFYATSTFTHDYDALIYFDHSSPSALLPFSSSPPLRIKSR